MRMGDYTYEGAPSLWLEYGDGATFIRVCETCGRFVKADATMRFNGIGELADRPNATCAKCGRTHMLFQGFI